MFPGIKGVFGLQKLAFTHMFTLQVVLRVLDGTQAQSSYAPLHVAPACCGASPKISSNCV